MSTCTPRQASAIALAVVVFGSSSALAQYSKVPANDPGKQGNFINRQNDNSSKGSSGPSSPQPSGGTARISSPQPAMRSSPNNQDPRIQLERDRLQWQQEQDRRMWLQDQRDRWYDRQITNANANYLNQNANRSFSGTGTVSAVRAGVLVVDAQGTTWQVKPDVGSKVEVIGTAGPDYLKPGLVVKFQAAFDPKGDRTKAVAPINELEIITPHIGEMPGAAPAGATAIAAAQNAAAVPGTARWLSVIGRVRSVKSNELIVDAGNGVFKTELDPATAIKVRVSDTSIVRAGDQIEASGYIANPGFAVASTIRVTMAHPLGNPLSEFGKMNAAVKTAGQPAAGK